MENENYRPISLNEKSIDIPYQQTRIFRNLSMSNIRHGSIPGQSPMISYNKMSPTEKIRKSINQSIMIND